jgi:hypothetical protein
MRCFASVYHFTLTVPPTNLLRHKLGHHALQLGLVLGEALNPLSQLCDRHFVLAMQLLKEIVGVGCQVDLGLAAAAHLGPQLARQRLCGGLQLAQQGRRDGNVVTPAKSRRSHINSTTLLLACAEQ